ncbi:MAG: hypothetical protein PHX08_11780 [Lachnospiraceae bacterium]|nr:hypothetical protein [Lachnospiraceae bacterium]
MKFIQKNKIVIKEFNAIVYARNRETLWEYRNVLYEINEQTDYHVDITLTGNANTVLRVAEFAHGGVDLIIENEAIDNAMLGENANIDLVTIVLSRQGDAYHIKVYDTAGVLDKRKVIISDRQSLQELLEGLLFEISTYYD